VHAVQVMRRLVVVMLAAAIGLALWLAFVVPLDQETNSPAFWWLMLAAAFVLGISVELDHAVLGAAALVVLPLVLCPWTAPRDDNDGLWLLWMPLLLLFPIALIGVAWLGSRARHLRSSP